MSAVYAGSTFVRGEVFIGSHVATYVGGHTYFHNQNWLGSRATTADESGTKVQDCEWYSFGELKACTTNTNLYAYTPYGYADYERDSETGLDHMQFRYYNARIGRFLGADPLDGSPGSPQSYNRLGYVANNPIGLTDDKGLCPAVAIEGHCGGVIMHPLDNAGSYVDGAYITGMNASLFHSMDIGSGYSACPFNVCSLNIHGQQVNYEADATGLGGYVGAGVKVDFGEAYTLAAFLAQDIADGGDKLDTKKSLQEQAVERYAAHFEVNAFVTGAKWVGHGFQVTFNLDVVTFLSKNPNFKKGPGFLLHLKDVGATKETMGQVLDYRSLTNKNWPMSLQVVVNQANAAGWMDLDRFNPYQGIRGFFGHNVCEVMHLC